MFRYRKAYNSFSWETWLAADIAGACAQRRKKHVAQYCGHTPAKTSHAAWVPLGFEGYRGHVFC